MKTKLISLLIALLCMTMLLVSCTDPCVEHIDANNDGICDVEGCEDAVKKVEVAEHEHVDANADKVCDVENCGTIIIVNTVTEKVEIVVPTKPEEKVDMVVKPIPAPNHAEYVNLDYAEKQAYFNKLFRAFEDEDYYDAYDYIIVKKSETETIAPAVEDDPLTEDVDEYYAGKFKNVYTVTDISGETELVILTLVNEYEGNNGYVGFDFDSEEFIQVVAGKNLFLYRAGVANTAPALTFERSKLDDSIEIDEYVTYVEYDGKVVVYDNASLAKLEEKDPDFFVDRPDFDAVEGTVGVVYDAESMQVYDLTKWISCVYTYEIPSYATDSEVFELANGTYLYQYFVQLPDNAVSYDLYAPEGKFDVVYEIVNPAAKTVSVAEFGYIISEQYGEEVSNFKFDGNNLFAVATINNNGSIVGAKLLIVDNELNVLYSVDNFVINQANTLFEIVADKYAKVEILLGNNVVDAVVNVETGVVTYLPANIDATYDTCYMVNDVLYNYDGTVKFDFRDIVDDENTANNVIYNFVQRYDSYFFVSKTTYKADVDETTGEPTGTFTSETKYYFYDVNTAGAALVEVKYENVVYKNNQMFIVKVITETTNELGATVETITYNVFNNDGGLLTTITDTVYGGFTVFYDAEAELCLMTYTAAKTVENATEYVDMIYIFGTAAPVAPAA
jgi:hypothetical protein